MIAISMIDRPDLVGALLQGGAKVVNGYHRDFKAHDGLALALQLYTAHHEHENAAKRRDLLTIMSLLLASPEQNSAGTSKVEHYSNGRSIHHRMAGWMTPLDYCLMAAGYFADDAGLSNELKHIAENLLKPC